ncbi:MAG: hypothetical protein JWM33_136, partial [Caulobacteraceae bacterium]|nr:hypothetical protein [Caulobacteraceae bacterium]
MVVSIGPQTLTVGAGGPYTTIQAAVAAANAGDTIFISNGDYTLSSTLNIDKSLTILGESEAGVTIHGASIGYGMNVTGDHVSLSDFTFVGSGVSQSGNYGIKVEPDTGAASDRVSDFSLSHVTV